MDSKTEKHHESKSIERTQNTRKKFVDRIQDTLDSLETRPMTPDKRSTNYRTPGTGGKGDTEYI